MKIYLKFKLITNYSWMQLGKSNFRFGIVAHKKRKQITRDCFAYVFMNELYYLF